ncbi:MAG: hypothetical protein RLZZ293_1522 [Pseudomonadota bacterium]|jgi:intracellular septation protein
MQNNILLEMFPLIGFFAVYYFSKNIFTATLVCIIASWLQVGLYQLCYKKVGKNTWISTILITVFGGLTIILHNKTFVMLKPTLLYWIFAISLLIADKLGKNGIKSLLQEQITLPETSWKQLNLIWCGLFILMGILNLVIAFYCTEYVWVKFKVFGGFALMIIGIIISACLVKNRVISK